MSTQPITLVPRVWTDEPLKPRRERLWLAEGKKCHWCKRPTRLDADSGNWLSATIDHIVPRYKGGGTNDESNVVSACARCNNRRNHEDMCGLPEGSLLGKWKTESDIKSHNATTRQTIHRTVLSGDEKKALMARMDKAAGKISAEDVLREQRDQSLKKIAELTKELSHWKSLANKLESMTIGEVIRKRIAIWILDRLGRSR